MPIRSLRTLRRMNDQKNITPSGGRGTDKRSCCLRIGGFIVIQKILKYYSIPEILEDYFKPKDAGLFLDLVAYSIIVRVMHANTILILHTTTHCSLTACISTATLACPLSSTL